MHQPIDLEYEQICRGYTCGRVFLEGQTRSKLKGAWPRVPKFLGLPTDAHTV